MPLWVCTPLEVFSHLKGECMTKETEIMKDGIEEDDAPKKVSAQVFANEMQAKDDVIKILLRLLRDSGVI
mgnify:CR=1 FL=1